MKNPLNFIKKVNRAINLYLMDHKTELNHMEKFDSFVIQYKTDQKQVQEQMNEFIQFRGRWDYYYNKNKEYFFNGEEELFDKIDTDQFFQMCLSNQINLLSYSPAENRMLLETKNGIRLLTDHYYFVVNEIFAQNEYSIPQLYSFDEFVVFDIGMNRGYAALKFANFDSCSAVYGFEINKNTYDFAQDNFRVNPHLAPKIKANNFGLSDVDDEIEIYSISEYDGLTTTELEFIQVHEAWMGNNMDIHVEKSPVKSAGKIISDIIKNDRIKAKIVIKIDTEGSEPKIIDNLIDYGLLDKIDVIMGEMHSRDYDLDEKLVGFKNVKKINRTETTYSFCFVKKELFNSNNS